MNKKSLEIFLRYRKRKYEKNLEELQHDLKHRDSIQSDERLVKEGRLRSDYEDEIAMKKEEVELLETERADQKRERKNAINTNRITTFVAIISSLIAFLTGWCYFTLSVRPYLVTEPSLNAGYSTANPTTWRSVLEKDLDGARVRFFINTEPDGKTTSTIATMAFALKNVGKTTLKYRLDSIKYFTGGELSTITENPNHGDTASYGVLVPDQAENIYYFSHHETQLLQTRERFALSGMLIMVKIEYEPIGLVGRVMPFLKYYILIEGTLSCNERDRICVTPTWHIKDAN